ncbi:hypothetical protein CANARDRAFT_28101 [[Candida] arabinofermentans NRRL YB-2248]|uniref:Ubiquinone biosynthesis protein n=1 Tax=[Candida] arabinofermentans NRRL YB-2248 TaxID=983967 RepID=A0A1E4T2U5_9ASCO|nr:hypothetical protein CANARDRAFT_28101 [[Candida] arabinofermentans NRRL YB-2248]
MLFRGSIAKPNLYRATFTNSITNRLFHTVYHADIPILDESIFENKILKKAYEDHVPETGFTEESIKLAAKGLNYNLDNLKGVFNFTSQSKDLRVELIQYHLKSCRLKLRNYHNDANRLQTETERVRFYLEKRLLENKPIIKYYHQALARMILPSNLTESLNELHKLSDDISFYSGDKSNDFAWYSKRFSLSGVFIQSELFMLNDRSNNFENTIEFMNDKMDEVDNMAYAYNSFEEWAIFNGISTVNLIKSQLARG